MSQRSPSFTSILKDITNTKQGGQSRHNEQAGKQRYAATTITTPNYKTCAYYKRVSDNGKKSPYSNPFTDALDTSYEMPYQKSNTNASPWDAYPPRDKSPNDARNQNSSPYSPYRRQEFNLFAKELKSFQPTNAASNQPKQKPNELNLKESMKPSQLVNSQFTPSPNYNPEKLYFNDPEIKKIVEAAKSRVNVDWKDPKKQKDYFIAIKESGVFNEKYYGVSDKEFNLRVSQLTQRSVTPTNRRGVAEFKDINHQLTKSGFVDRGEKTPTTERTPTRVNKESYVPAFGTRVDTETSNVLDTSGNLTPRQHSVAGQKEIRGVRPSNVSEVAWKTPTKSPNRLVESRVEDSVSARKINTNAPNTRYSPLLKITDAMHSARHL